MVLTLSIQHDNVEANLSSFPVLSWMATSTY